MPQWDHSVFLKTQDQTLCSCQHLFFCSAVVGYICEGNKQSKNSSVALCCNVRCAFICRREQRRAIQHWLTLGSCCSAWSFYTRDTSKQHNKPSFKKKKNKRKKKKIITNIQKVRSLFISLSLYSRTLRTWPDHIPQGLKGISSWFGEVATCIPYLPMATSQDGEEHAEIL